MGWFRNQRKNKKEIYIYRIKRNTSFQVKEGGNNYKSFCESNHLTTFGTGFFAAPNSIDFDFITADFDYADNVTILMVILITIIIFLVTLIWAQLKDRKDIIDVSTRFSIFC